MKVSELSKRSGVPLPTIKFYIREGLLPAGTRTAPNQADYGPEHLERLTLIRALRDDAGLPLEAIARALRAADEAKDEFVLAAIDALERPLSAALEPTPQELATAHASILALIERRGWDLGEHEASVHSATAALVAIERSFPGGSLDQLERYARVADEIAACEIPDDWDPDAAPQAALRFAVLGTMLFEPLILALRRMAHVARSRRVQREHSDDRT